MRFTVGGESFELTREGVIEAMRGAPIEPIRTHIVEIEGEIFPPKQVFATVTGRGRQSFTTMEAQRVLTRLGFTCHRAGRLEDGRPPWVANKAQPSSEDRLASIESAIGTIQAAIAGLQRRVNELESAG